MRESAMVLEPECASAETRKDIKVGRLRSEREGQRRERRLAVEPGAPQACAGQEMSDGFQEVECILFSAAHFRQTYSHILRALTKVFDVRIVQEVAKLHT